MEFILNNCICNAKGKRSKLFECNDLNFKTTEISTELFQCQNCSSIFPGIFPSQETIGEAYQKYYTIDTNKNLIKIFISKLINLIRINYVYRNINYNNRRILDYGCGSGKFLITIHKKYKLIKLFGTDLLKPNHLNENLINWIDLRELFKSYKQNFDWITLNHVVEHTHNPENLLLNLKGLLTIKGGLWISTPNANSILLNYFGKFSRDVDFPRHRIIFSKYKLQSMLEGLGYQVEFIVPPRINLLFNLSSCVNNLLKNKELKKYQKLLILLKAITYIVVHNIQSSKKREKSAPELIVVARN
jgi:SAM-dependent methyltransferase